MAKRQGRPLRSRDVVGSTATRRHTPSATSDDAPSATSASGHVRVRATANGFYNGSRIRAGAELTVDPKAFATWPRWMERLDDSPARRGRELKEPALVGPDAATGAANVLGDGEPT